MQIIRAIVAGERDPVILAQLRDPRCKSSEDAMVQALEGNYRPEHVFALQQALELYDFYTQQLAACDVQIEQHHRAFEPQVKVEDHPLPPAKRPSRRQGNEPAFDLRTRLYETCGVDLTRVDGLDAVLVQDIISETGVDMSPWRTEKHCASWLRICPYNDISGGKVLKSKTGRTANRATLAFRLAAQAVSRSDSALGAYYRRMRARHGAPKAITATAHKIARIVYHMLKHKEEYVDLGADHYEQQYRERAIRNLKHKARKLGLEVVPAAAPA